MKGFGRSLHRRGLLIFPDESTTFDLRSSSTGIEWFGRSDNLYGIGIVLIGGKRVIDTYSNRIVPRKQQRLFTSKVLGTFNRDTG